MEKPSEEKRDEAEINALIEQNLRLVQKIANDFLGRGLAWDDLVSEGNRGLVTAARRYDPGKGARFSTYSAWWIKQAIRQAISEQGRTVRVPIGTELNWRKVRRSIRRLTRELERDPSDEEVAADTGLPRITVTRLRNGNLVEMHSLNAPLDGEEPDGGSFIDSLRDVSERGPDQQMVHLEDVEQLLKLLETLPERERRVLRLRFGLDGEAVRTLDEVGDILHCTNERVRQIQNKALRELHRKLEARR